MTHRYRGDRTRKALAIVALVGTVLVGAAAAAGLWGQVFGAHPRPAPPAPSAMTPRPVLPPAENIKPLAVRPVVEAVAAADGQCPADGPPPVVPTEPLSTCDFARTTAYVLGPQEIELQLRNVDTVKTPAGEFYSVRVTMAPSSATEFGTFTARQVGKQIAFVRNGVVASAPEISEEIDSQLLELTGNLTAAQAEELARLLRQPP